MLMDDGFQHLPLKKHLTILLDPLNPPNRFCLPAGPYREPRRNRVRGDLRLPGELSVTYLPTVLRNPAGLESLPSRYGVLCALGKPERFIEDLRTHCAPAHGFDTIKLLPDHDPMTDGRLFESFSQGVPIVVTAKDWVKLRDRPDLGERIFLIATQSAKVERLEIVEQRIQNRI
jgi:tetraacyldisaccharide 4'-kinase